MQPSEINKRLMGDNPENIVDSSAGKSPEPGADDLGDAVEMTMQSIKMANMAQ